MENVTSERREARAEELLKRQQERWAAEDAKWQKYNTEYNRQQMEDSCEGEEP